MTCNLLSFQNNFIDVSVHVPNKVVWRLTCFYGFPERYRRKDSWNRLRILHGNSSLPWCIFGDFNDLLSPVIRWVPLSILADFFRAFQRL